MARILVDGSSTAHGLWGGLGGGWADRLKTSILVDPDRKQYSSVINLAVPLRTVLDIASEFACNARAYGGSSPVRLALLQLGMSESRRLGGTWAVPPEEFGAAVARIIAGCVESGFEPIFLGMPPFDETRTRDFGRERASYLGADRALYDAIVREQAKAAGYRYVDVAAALSGLPLDEILDVDGLHVNALGHHMIHELVTPLVRSRIVELKGVALAARAESPVLV